MAYETNDQGVSNNWLQSLEGGKAEQLTDFKSDRISYFDWSADGKQLACIRGGWLQDIVLISNLK